jgi:S1-C subfamily serine protease
MGANPEDADGTPVDSVQQPANLIAAQSPGDRVTLDGVRAGRSRTVSVTPGNA